MALRLVIADIVDFPVRFTVNDNGKTTSFAFNLVATRVPQGELQALIGDNSDATVSEFLVGKITGWKGQRLVLDDAGNPAEFSPDALACMFSLAGLPGVAFTAYLSACGAKGKEKN